MHKSVQEGNAWKLTIQSILMHLLQKNSPDYIWDAQEFPISTYTQKERRPYLY